MKVLLIITSLGVGGAEKVVTSLASFLRKLNHEVLLVVLKGSKVSVPVDPKVKVIVLSMKYKPYDIFHSLVLLRKIIKNFNPDVINCHLFHSIIILRLLRVFVPLNRLIGSVHSMPESFFRMAFYRVTDRLSDKLTIVSQNCAKGFLKYSAVHPDKIEIIYNGTNFYNHSSRSGGPSRATPKQRSGGEFLLISVGSLSKLKDYPTMLRAMQIVRRSFSGHVKLLVVGDGPQRDTLKALSHSLQLEDSIDFLGIRSDIPTLLSAADLFVMSSVTEGIPLALLEAMAHGLPVIATGCGGIPEVIDNPEYLVPIRDPHALASGILKMLQKSPDLLEGLGKANRLVIEEKFSEEAMLKKYLDVYSQV